MCNGIVTLFESQRKTRAKIAAAGQQKRPAGRPGAGGRTKKERGIFPALRKADIYLKGQ